MELLNFPLLVLIDVFKHMEIRERLLISLMSKRAKRMLNQTSMPVHLVVDFAEDVYIHVGTDTKPSRSNVTDQASDHIIGGEVMRMSFYPDGLTLQNESLQNHLLLTAHLLDKYRKSTVSVEFCYPTQPALAWEFMKMVNQRRVPVKSFSFLIYAASSEFIPKILDECTEVTDLIWFNAMLPDNFFYTPPRPFKATEFRVNIATKWFDPQSFMSCRRIILKINRNSTWTAQWWNAFIQNWIDSDVALEYLSCNHTESSNFLEMISGLSQPGVEQISDELVEVKRRNGTEFVIRNTLTRFYIMTKKEHKKNKNLVDKDRFLFF